MERDDDDDRRRRDDVTANDVTVTSSMSSSSAAVMSKFLRELKVVSGLAWPTVNKAVVHIRLRPGPVLPGLVLPPGETV